MEKIDKDNKAFNKVIEKFAEKVFKKNTKARGLIISMIEDRRKQNDINSSITKGIVIENKNFRGKETKK